MDALASPRLERLALAFELDPFDQDAFLVCLAPDLDLRYERLYAYLQDDVTRKRPNVDLILRLASSSDALIESYRPGTMERLGVCPSACLAVNPRLTYVRLTGWGQDGSLAQAPGHDLNYIGMSGALSLFERDGMLPSGIPPLIGDMAGGGLFMAFGLLAAVLEARQSGIGQVVDSAIVDGSASLFALLQSLHKAGAHAVPAEYRSDREGYLHLLCEMMLPEVARSGLAEFCDVFCETGVFDCAESQRILSRARDLGLRLKLHADELTPLGGAELAVQLGAVSADHLLCVTQGGVERLAHSDTVATLLPGTAFFLGLDYAPARRLIDNSVYAEFPRWRDLLYRIPPACRSESCLQIGRAERLPRMQPGNCRLRKAAGVPLKGSNPKPALAGVER